MPPDRILKATLLKELFRDWGKPLGFIKGSSYWIKRAGEKALVLTWISPREGMERPLGAINIRFHLAIYIDTLAAKWSVLGPADEPKRGNCIAEISSFYEHPGGGSWLVISGGGIHMQTQQLIEILDKSFFDLINVFDDNIKLVEYLITAKVDCFKDNKSELLHDIGKLKTF